MTVLAWGLAACGQSESSGAVSRENLDPDEIRSGYAFLTPETQNLQDDEFANPGFLWADRGKALFESGDGAAQACAACHDGPDTDLRGTATRYPAMDEETGTLVNLEARINLCRTRHQNTDALAYESEDLLSLTAYVASLSRGLPVAVSVSDRTQRSYDLGEAYFFTRRGQLNLACSQCHNQSWGKQLRGDTISQGHGNGFPAYRLEWETLGSLHRRLRDCDVGVRAEPHALGSETYTALEFYLAVRAKGLPVETPAVRR